MQTAANHNYTLTKFLKIFAVYCDGNAVTEEVVWLFPPPLPAPFKAVIGTTHSIVLAGIVDVHAVKLRLHLKKGKKERKK